MTEGANDSLAALLEEVPEPDSVIFLSLCRMGCDENLGRALRKFDCLSVGVEFRAGTWHRDCVSALRDMKLLKEITLDAWTTITTDDLACLITGPKKHPSLETIDLQNIRDVGSNPYGTDSDSDDEWERYDGWTDDFTLKGLADLLEVADKEGVKCEGLAVKLARQELACRRRAAAASKASS
ncbi:hypothetical protein NBRC10512_001466 [Rhodotorula toruloides]|uniref:RHTO0S29e00914g1_1 n=2 Tax=Rhodotorula toruloides TaxID=5286 RepID=A0A061BJV1_RHOTO|nr:uncharacterized protein RHTO_06429 [Rhodotorula toruloides NP11]EMS18386.1 hypothetical protein RHTO_06429 [Rhodotorula toruloides NP11]CDR49659.1 RHTO0S29e00914g1_1 [Rhodotorula toruloides]